MKNLKIFPKACKKVEDFYMKRLQTHTEKILKINLYKNK